MINEQRIRLDVSFTQIVIFSSSVEHPFNDWSDARFAQGFSWRADSVSFRTIEDGPHIVKVVFSRELPIPDTAAVRAITVPLKLSDETFEIASVSDSVCMPAVPAEYQIMCEFLPRDATKSRHVKITLARNAHKLFAVLVADDQINNNDLLDTNSAPIALWCYFRSP